MLDLSEVSSDAGSTSTALASALASPSAGSSSASAAGKALFLEKVRQSNAACQAGDFALAVRLYTEAIALDPANHILFSNRSAAHIKMGGFAKALHDAVRARELNPEWPKAYYREGVALQCLARHGEALAAFSSGLAHDPKSTQLLAGIVEAAMKSPLRAALEPTYRQLQAMKLDKSPFVIISVVGQELLAQGKFACAVDVLESALKIGTCSLKLRGSVFSALSSAYWALNMLDKAINYMQQDLVVAKQLNDVGGECRAHGNLGSAFFSKGNYKEALTSHRYQLVLAMKCKDSPAAAAALTSLGHVYSATGDLQNALASHRQCVELAQQLGDRLLEAREMGNVGAVHLAMGDLERAVACHSEHLRLAVAMADRVEEARAYSNLGSAHHAKRNFDQAVRFHERVLRLAGEVGDRGIEARAYAGLGHAARCIGNLDQAKEWHEKQLQVALATKDKVGEGRACSNLGIVYHQLGDFDAALKLHQAHLQIARHAHDRAAMGRAFGNIGNAYSASGFYEQAVKYHKQEMTISKEVGDRSSEAATHGNLAVAYQALGMHEMALVHYHGHLNIAREARDSAGEALALCNLANCHAARAEFAQAVPFYESYLMLSQELNDVEGEARACHFLGYAHYRLGNHKEAIRYYDQDLALARHQQDRTNMGRAYCNLGLAHLAVGNLDSALECQKLFLGIAQSMKPVSARFRALGNVGDVLLRMGRADEAAAAHHKQLALARAAKDKGLEAAAFGALGNAARHDKKLDKALAFHTQELSILQDVCDLKGECRAHGHLGAVHMALANFISAAKCYSEQLERARDIKDAALEAEAHANLGLAKLSLSRHEEAIGCFEQQLAALEQVVTASSPPAMLLERARAFGNLGACYEALGDHDEAVKWLDKYLAVAEALQAVKDLDRAYRELGVAHKNMGNLQQALVCLEKRLVAAHDLSSDHSSTATGWAYAELGEIHCMLGNFEQAVSCMQQQLKASRTSGDPMSEARALSGLGCVHHRMGEFIEALRHHEADLSLSQAASDRSGEARALLHVAASREALGQVDEAVEAYKNSMDAVATMHNDAEATATRIQALASLGQLKLSSGNLEDGLSFLRDGLQLAEQSCRREDEARIRHRMGLALFRRASDLGAAQHQLERAVSLFEAVRREAASAAASLNNLLRARDYKLSLFDAQTECYSALERTLVLLGRDADALLVAEKARNRAMHDLAMERHGRARARAGLERAQPETVSDILTMVNRQKASVLYYSIAEGYLHVWLILPVKGIVKFHQARIEDDDGGNILEERIESMRESLGVSGASISTGNDNDDPERPFSMQLDALGDKLNGEGDRSGFLRMVSRGSRLNASSYSLSSLFSVGSLGAASSLSAAAAASRHGSSRSRRSNRSHWAGPSSARALYQMLVAPMEDDLPEGYPCELMLVLEGDLYLVPFAMLKAPDWTECFCEKYSLIVAPSLSSTRVAKPKPSLSATPLSTSLVVGNPRLPSTVSEEWGWEDIPQSAQEASTVAEILQVSAVTGEEATKTHVMRQMEQAEIIHLSCHVSFKLSAIVLSPGNTDVLNPAKTNARRYSINSDTIQEEDDLRSEVASTIDMPALSEFLLTAADILNLRLSAKLVVVSSCYSRDEQGQVTSEGLVSLTRALLAAGAHCVVASLWPVPATAVKVVMKTLYSSLLQGARVSRALADAMTTAQNTKQLQHPANWAGFVVVGADVRLSNKVALMGQALRDMISTPEMCKEALRVTLHLVEKSLQRIGSGHKNAMYTSQQSIENKVASKVNGWKELLMSVGFRFEPATNGLPASVFFPTSDPSERLTQCSASLQAILGLSNTSWAAMAKLLVASSDETDEIIALFRQMCGQSVTEEASSNVSVSARLWRVAGCHELLASLGFDLMEVGRDDVVLKGGRTANRRQLQFAFQALMALFDTQEAPRCVQDNDEDEEDQLTEDQSNSGDKEDDDDALDGMRADFMPPFPAPRKSGFVLDVGPTSAFSSYVKNRGEPDGRQAASGDSPPNAISAVATVAHAKGHESDCNFTPSPVEPMPRMFAAQRVMTSTVTARFSHSHAGPFTYGQHRAVGRNLDLDPQTRATDSSSPSEASVKSSRSALLSNQLYSSLYENTASMMVYNSRQPAGRPVMPVRSVFTDVGYQSGQKLTDTSDPNDKFSVRAEPRRTVLSDAIKSLRKVEKNADVRLNPGVTKRMPPTGEADTPENILAVETASVTTVSSANTFIIKSDDGGDAVKTTSMCGSSDQLGDLNGSIQDSLRNCQMRRLTSLSDVYHERSGSKGLGLAPPLSSIIMSNNMQVVQVDHHSDSEGSLARARAASSTAAAAVEESFSNIDNLSVVAGALSKSSLLAMDPQPQPPPAKRRPPVPPKPTAAEAWSPARATALIPRDDGDGRSMSDSQYSGYSPNGQPPKEPRSPTSTDTLAARMSYLKMKDYVNTEEIKVVMEESDEADQQMHKGFGALAARPNGLSLFAKGSDKPSLNGDIKHPHHMWTRDRNGALYYTGMFSSDC